ncbi:GNAT family N-acetyltransferase [Gymnodinialimonas sp. 2305UL16-5]|uniref:GNAT family N-acetyltransferase n=1 Tax=Gymnodinialimonas mytili TaxID=3126503 RepID=UPI00309D4225
MTLAEAASEPAAYVFAIWAGATRVRLIASIDMTELNPAEVAPEDEPEAIFNWRLMIDREHQRQGHGTTAIRWACDWGQATGRPRVARDQAL